MPCAIELFKVSNTLRAFYEFDDSRRLVEETERIDTARTFPAGKGGAPFQGSIRGYELDTGVGVPWTAASTRVSTLARNRR